MNAPAYWLDRGWAYIPAATHATAEAFAARQRERLQRAIAAGQQPAQTQDEREAEQAAIKG